MLLEPAVPATTAVAGGGLVGLGGGTTGIVPFSHWAIEEGKEQPSGPFGRIFEINYRNRRLAARHVRRDLLVSDGIAGLTAQAAALTLLVHRNILHIVGFCIDHPPDVFVLTEVQAG